MKNLLITTALVLLSLVSFAQDKVTFNTNLTYFSEDINLKDYNEFITKVTLTIDGETSLLILNKNPYFYKVSKDNSNYSILLNERNSDLVFLDKNNKKVYIITHNYNGLNLTLYSANKETIDEDMSNLMSYFKYYYEGKGMNQFQSRYLALKGLINNYYKNQ